MNKGKGSFVGLLPVIVFLVIYFAVGICTGTFDQSLPLMMGIFIASVISLIITSPVAEKKTLAEKIVMFCKGGGDDTLILMVVIYMLAGAFYSISIATGAREAMGQLGVALLPPRLILPAIFLVSMAFSFSMGTSMGTVNTVMTFATAFAPLISFGDEKTKLAVICGIVVGGAMFGDNLSFISDTTIAATSTQDVAMRSKFQQNILMCLPAVIVTFIALAFIPITVPEATTLAGINWIVLLPFLLIIVLSLVGMHVLPAMTISIALAGIIGVAIGKFPLFHIGDTPGVFEVIHEGMMWMQDMAVIAIFIGGICAMMNYLGGIQWLIDTMSKNVKTSKGCELVLAFLAFIVDVATTNNTVSIIAIGPIARDLSDKFGVARERTASILDIFSSVGNGISPHAGQLLAAGSLAGISPASIVMWCWYPILMGISSLIFIIFGIAVPTKKKV